MEAARLAPKAPRRPAHPVLVAIRRFAGKWGLIVALAALPVYYAIHDLMSGYPAFVNGHATTVHDLTYIGTNLFQGISNGAIWALIAIGYTLVYGIIELINFAHGDVFMIGSLTAAGFWAGDRADSGDRDIRRDLWPRGGAARLDARLRRPERADRAGRLPAASQRAQSWRR